MNSHLLNKPIDDTHPWKNHENKQHDEKNDELPYEEFTRNLGM